MVLIKNKVMATKCTNTQKSTISTWSYVYHFRHLK